MKDITELDGKTEKIRILKKDGNNIVVDYEMDVTFQSYRLTAEDMEKYGGSTDMSQYAQVTNEEKGKRQQKQTTDTDTSSTTKINMSDFGKSTRKAHEAITKILWGIEHIALKSIVGTDWARLLKVVKDLDVLDLKAKEEEEEKKIKEVEEALDS